MTARSSETPDTVVSVPAGPDPRSRSTVTPTTTLVPLFELARGGMGRIEVAARRGPGFERLYAMKRLLSELAADPDARQMFLDEGRIAGLIRHPNVVSVLDVGEDAHGPYLLMDYVEGISLASLLSTPAIGALPIDECLYVVHALAQALHAAHELRHHDGTMLELIHRDVSPSNVLVGVNGEVWLSDFGIARTLTNDHRTRTGVLKGKVGYMAPEQLRFELLDRRSDLFSLGVVTYELLAGARLYRDPDGRIVAQRILHEPPPDLSEVRRDAPPELTRLVFELLAKQPSDRPSTAHEVASTAHEIARANDFDLAEARATLGRLVREHFGPELARRRERVLEALARVARDEHRARARGKTKRRVVVAAAVVTLAAIGGGVWLALVTGSEPPARAAIAGATPDRPPVASPPDPVGREADSAATIVVDAGIDAGLRRLARRARARTGRDPEPTKMDPSGRWVPLAP